MTIANEELINISFSWFLKSIDTVDTVSKFTNMWFSFNSLYKINNQKNELNNIIKFIENNFSENDALYILTHCNDSIILITNKPVVNMKKGNIESSLYIGLIRSELLNIDKLTNLFKIIYIIRCNLIHGDKNPNNERDILLCNHSQIILECLLNLYFKRKGMI